MQYQKIASFYEKIEKTTKRLEMTDLLAQLFKETPRELISKIVYLTQGKVFPDFVELELGIAEKLAIRALAHVSGKNQIEIQESIKQTGDLGETTKIFLSHKLQTTFLQTPLSVNQVYFTFDKMARLSGSGAVSQKVSLLSGLLSNSVPLEAKYVIRMVTGNLRLGIADMTVIDALAITYGGGKKSRKLVERAYNISSDLGRVSEILAKKGLNGLKFLEVVVSQPIRPMLAERLTSSSEILAKMDGRCIAEYKYDGERIQIHKSGQDVTLFSRRLEKVSLQYPDIIQLVIEHIKAKKAILEGEIVAVTEEGGLLPFQELMHRRRKYGIKKAVQEYPVTLFLFDLLYLEGDDLTLCPYSKRRQSLQSVVDSTANIQLVKSSLITDTSQLDDFFQEAIEFGCEGLICKSLSKNSFYQAGSRGWNWIKYKRDYKSELIDTIDLVIVGAVHGRGRRAGTYGTFLLATYNSDNDTFETSTKCGTGFTDKDLVEISRLLKYSEIPQKNQRLKTIIKSDVWFEPSLVLEILGAEITLSPVHTCGMDRIRKGCGLGIRFPRFTGKYRKDKAPEDSTTSKEIIKMYQKQLKQV